MSSKTVGVRLEMKETRGLAAPVADEDEEEEDEEDEEEDDDADDFEEE